MMRSTSRSFLASFGMLIVCLPAVSGAQSIVSVEKISKNQLGIRGNDDSGSPAVCANRPRVVFQSRASNLVQGDNNGVGDVFLRRGATDAVVRISENRLGVGGDGRSTNPSITPTAPGGLFAVLFESLASNLVRRSDLQDTNGLRDIFISVPTRNFTERVSVGPNLAEANGASFEPSATLVPEPNRILVAYRSLASNLVTGDENSVSDIFLATILNPKEDGSFLESGFSTLRASSAFGGGDSNGASFRPRVSRDGSKIIFESDATNLVSGNLFSGTTPTHRQVYLYDVATNTTELISKATNGTPGDAASGAASLNFSGTVVAYVTAARNILSDGRTAVDGAVQIVRYDVRTGVSTRVNVAADGSPGNGTQAEAVAADLDATGRFVAFSDGSSNVVPADTNGVPDVFLFDAEGGAVVRVSESALGVEANAGSAEAVLARGRFNADDLSVLFSSNASTLIADDSGNAKDVFATRLTVPPRTLSKNTSLEVPPDTELEGSDVTFTAESFNTASNAFIGSNSVSAATRRQTFYDIRITREGRVGRAADNRRKLTKRNEIAFKRLKSGTYVAKYRVLVKRGTKIVSKTKFSPPQRFSKDDVET